MERENERQQKKKKKEESARIRRLVGKHACKIIICHYRPPTETAERFDPRILKRREDERLEKQRTKDLKKEQIKKKYQEVKYSICGIFLGKVIY